MTAPEIQSDVALDRMNTFGLKARAEHFCRVDSVQALAALSRDRVWGEGPSLVLGGGSNLILSKDVAGLVVKVDVGGLHFTEDATGFMVRVGAGMNWDALVRCTIEASRGGLENLIAIPGNVGAAPVQNIGAYGVELDQRMALVEVFDCVTKTMLTLDAKDCRFGYRDSLFKHQPNRYIITSVTLRLPKPWQPVVNYRGLEDLEHQGVTPDDIAARVSTLRAAKLPDPARIGNVGSFFKNPVVTGAHFEKIRTSFADVVGYPGEEGRVKLAAAWLIEAAGWKGRGIGRAAMHDQQALVMINQGDASAKDVLALASAVSASVTAKFAVTLEREPVLI